MSTMNKRLLEPHKRPDCAWRDWALLYQNARWERPREDYSEFERLGLFPSLSGQIKGLIVWGEDGLAGNM